MVAAPFAGGPRRRHWRPRAHACCCAAARPRTSSGTSPVETGASTLLWNRRYGGPEREVDAGVKAWAAEQGLTAASFQANLMFEPWTVRTGAGGPYKVFTPFWRACLDGAGAPAPAGRPGAPPGPGRGRGGQASRPATRSTAGGCSPAGRTGAPASPSTWQPGEAGARQRLEDFLDGPAEEYGTGRDIPGVEGTSRLSAHLRFGEISPFRIWHALREQLWARGAGRRRDLPLRTRLAGVLLAAALREPGAGHPELPARVRPLRLADAVGRRTRSLAAGPHRLSPGGRRHAPALADRLDAQPRPDGRRESSWSRTCWPTGGSARPGSGTRWWTPTPRATRRTGSGWPDPAPTPRRTSGSSTRSPRARSSTPAAATCASTSRSCPALDDKAIHEPWKADGAAAGYPDTDRRAAGVPGPGAGDLPAAQGRLRAGPPAGRPGTALPGTVAATEATRKARINRSGPFFSSSVAGTGFEPVTSGL